MVEAIIRGLSTPQQLDMGFVPLEKQQGRMQVNERFFRFIEEQEGFREVAYDDARPAHALSITDRILGHLTIGFGHTGDDVWIGKVISRQEAIELLLQDTKWAADAVNKYVKVPLTQNQFNALVSFVYNIGVTQFRTSTLVAKLNGDRNKDGVLESPPDYSSVPTELRRWVYSADGPVLANRREREVALWMERDDDSGHAESRRV